MRVRAFLRLVDNCYGIERKCCDALNFSCFWFEIHNFGFYLSVTYYIVVLLMIGALFQRLIAVVDSSNCLSNIVFFFAFWVEIGCILKCHFLLYIVSSRKFSYSSTKKCKVRVAQQNYNDLQPLFGWYYQLWEFTFDFTYYLDILTQYCSTVILLNLLSISFCFQSQNWNFN